MSKRRCQRVWFRYVRRWAIMVAFFFIPVIADTQTTILVLTPDTLLAQAAYAELIEGIRREKKATIIEVAVSEQNTRPAINAELARYQPDAVIAIGRIMAEAALALPMTIPVIVGGLVLSPQINTDVIGVNLAVPAQPVFERLRLLVPTINRVHVVYDPTRFQWLIDQADEAAQALGLTLVTYAATDFPTSGRLHNQLLETLAPAHDSLWLMWDGKLIDDRLLLDVIVEKAWNRRLTVFAQKLTYVRLGALFAVYPDLNAAGQQLVQLAIKATHEVLPTPYIEQVDTTLLGLHIPMARRLGVPLKSRITREVDRYYEP